jgi:hypothetical protein
MNSFNTFHNNINRRNNKIGQMYYRVVSAGLSAMNGTVVKNISGFSAIGITPGFYSYTPANLVGTPLAIYNNTSPPPPFGRSYNVLTINRITGAITTTTYDVYNGTGSTPLTNYLNSLTSSVIVVIATWDEPQNNATGLITAIKRCGGSSNFPSFINLRGAYVLLGIPGIGTNNGIERYVGDTSAEGDINAAIDLRFTVSNGEYSEENNYTNNLVLWYTFDSNTLDGTTLRDLMKNYNATIYSATFDTANKKQGNTSASFAGMTTSTNTPHIDVANLPASLTNQNALSFSFWFRSNNTGVFGRIFDFANGVASNNIIAFIYDNDLGFSVFNGEASGTYIKIVSKVNDNVWRHCVWVLTSGTWQIYINGLLDSTITGVNFPQNVERTINYIGKSQWQDNAGYNGNIDDFRMYKEALTQEKVTILYNYK